MDDFDIFEIGEYSGKANILRELAWAYIGKPCYLPKFGDPFEYFRPVSSIKNPNKYLTLEEATKEFLSILMEDKEACMSKKGRRK